MLKTKLKNITRPLIAVLLLYAIFKFGLIDLKQLSLSLANPVILISGLIIFSLHALTFAWRWKIIVNLETQNIESTYTYKQAVRDSFIGNFFNFFIPSGVGGDVIKAIALSERKKITKRLSFSFITLDRVLGLFCLILFSTSFLLIEYIIGMPDKMAQLLQISLLFLALACTGLLFLYHSKRIIPHLKNKFNFYLIQKLISFAEHLQANIEKSLKLISFSKIIFVSLIAQCLSVGFLYLISVEYSGSPVSFFLFLPLACFAFMASAIPLTPAGIGVGQAAFYFIFSIINPEIATAVTTGISLMQFFMLIVSLPGGYFFALSRKSS